MNSQDWLNLFSITRFRYIEVFSIYFTVTGGKQNYSLYRRLRYTEVRYIEVPLYICFASMLFLVQILFSFVSN